MAAEIQPVRPHISIDADSPGAEQLQSRILFVDKRFQEDPHRFLFALEELGGLATHTTLSLRDQERFIPTPSIEPTALITEYFRCRYDVNVEYDPETQADMKRNPELQQLIHRANDLRPVRRTKGVMGSESEPNPEAQEATNAVRRATLGHYLGRIASYNEQNLVDKLQAQRYSSAV